jgi:hypothetical protein
LIKRNLQSVSALQASVGIHQWPRLLALISVARGSEQRLANQQRLLKEATDLFGRKTIAEGLGISPATLVGWMSANSEMSDTMLIALARLLVKLAGKDPK